MTTIETAAMTEKGDPAIERAASTHTASTHRVTEPGPDLFRGDGLVVELQTGLPTEEVQRRLALAMRVGEACNRALSYYLADLADRRLHQALGYPDVIDFAQQRLGMGRSRAYQLLATGRRRKQCHTQVLFRIIRFFRTLTTFC